MSSHTPVDQPSHEASLLDRVSVEVRKSLLLRGVLLLTLLDYTGALLLALVGVVPWVGAGILILLSGFTWYFGLGIPLLNRDINERIGSPRMRYWSDVMEMFGRVVLVAHSVLFAVMLVFLAS